MQDKLTLNAARAKRFERLNAAMDAFEGSSFNRDNIGSKYVAQGGFGYIIEVYGPLGSFLGWLR